MAIIQDTSKSGPSLEAIKKEDAERVVGALTSLDRDHWAELWSKLGQEYEAQADKLAAAGGDPHQACETYLLSFDYFRIARYPVPSTPGKQTAYRNSLRVYLKAAKYFDPPLESVELPFEDKKL